MRAALEIWRTSLVEAGRSWVRSLPALAALLLYPLVLGLLRTLVGGSGFAGGLLLGLVHAACAGSYLFLIEGPVRTGRRVAWGELRESVGPYFQDVISVLFLFWIAGMVIELLGVPFLGVLFHLVVFVVLNPVPEVIYLGRASSTQALGRAASFTQQAWPEWFAPQLLALLLLNLLVPGHALDSLGWFGPFFGFLDAAQPAVASLLRGSARPGLLLQGLLLVAAAHYLMLLRGHLYRRLAGSSRRARAWRARLGDPP